MNDALELQQLGILVLDQWWGLVMGNHDEQMEPMVQDLDHYDCPLVLVVFHVVVEGVDLEYIHISEDVLVLLVGGQEKWEEKLLDLWLLDLLEH